MSDEPEVLNEETPTPGVPEPTPTLEPTPAPEPTIKDVMEGITGLAKRVTDMEESGKAMTPEEMEQFFAEEPAPGPGTPPVEKGPIDYETASMSDIIQNVYDEVKSTYVDPLTTKVAQLTARVEFNDLKDRFGDGFMRNRAEIARVGMANPHLSMEAAYFQVMGKNPQPAAPKTPPDPNVPGSPPVTKPVIPIGEKEIVAPGAAKPEPISDLDGAADEAYNEVMKGIK